MSSVSLEQSTAYISFSQEEFEILNDAVNDLRNLPEMTARQHAVSRPNLASIYTNWHGWGVEKLHEDLRGVDALEKGYHPLIHNGTVVARLGRLPLSLLASLQSEHPVLQAASEDIEWGVPQITLVKGSIEYYRWLYWDMEPEALDRLSDRLSVLKHELDENDYIEVDDPSHSTGLNILGLNLFTGKAALAVYNIPFKDERYDAGIIIDSALTDQLVDVSIAQRDSDGNHIHNAIINNLPHLRLV